MSIYCVTRSDPATGICFDDIIIRDTETWRWSVVEVESGKPPAWHSHCTGLFEGIYLLVFGGARMHGTLGDIWIFNTGDRTWITPVVEGKPPCPREVHTGTMVTDGRLLVFGGRSPAGQVLCDFSIFDGDTGMWVESVPTPYFLCCHSCVALPVASPAALPPAPHP
ncbi:g12168 [Coccomyxa viridis]|uniref:G12168 protein n=1 Tax=Coccomyxa viridis TaxID=1274662 RepID=A0ABP1GEC7_9CHLO